MTREEAPLQVGDERVPAGAIEQDVVELGWIELFKLQLEHNGAEASRNVQAVGVSESGRVFEAMQVGCAR